MISMVLQPLKKVQQAAVPEQAAALAVSGAVSAAMAVIRSSILRVVRMAIWMISLGIFSEICSAEAAVDLAARDLSRAMVVLAARDSSRVMAAALAAVVSRAKDRIFMQRSGSALKMQPLAVRK